MAIKRYFATADNTITNAFKQNLRQRGTGSNMGEADVLEVFSIYGQTLATGSESGRPSQELSRVLVKFPVSGTAAGEIKGDRTAGVIPKSGSVNFYLRMFNAKHASTLPRDASYTIQAVSQSWVEGTGLDMEEYKDFGESNWMQRAKGADWGKNGGDYWSGSYAPGYTFPTYTVTQEVGPEDIELDITSMVEEWIKGTQENFGLGVRLITTQEAYFSPSTGADLNNGVLKNTSGAKKSYFTKKFFARGSQFFFKRPMIEARWDSSTKDNRGNCKFSSSLAPSADNLNTLYLYNFIDGQLKDIPVIGTTGQYVTESLCITDCCPVDPIEEGYECVYSPGSQIGTCVPCLGPTCPFTTTQALINGYQSALAWCQDVCQEPLPEGFMCEIAGQPCTPCPNPVAGGPCYPTAKECLDNCVIINENPCPPLDLNSPYYGLGHNNFCSSDWCIPTWNHQDCQCCEFTPILSTEARYCGTQEEVAVKISEYTGTELKAVIADMVRAVDVVSGQITRTGQEYTKTNCNECGGTYEKYGTCSLHGCLSISKYKKD